MTVFMVFSGKPLFARPSPLQCTGTLSTPGPPDIRRSRGTLRSSRTLEQVYMHRSVRGLRYLWKRVAAQRRGPCHPFSSFVICVTHVNYILCKALWWVTTRHRVPIAAELCCCFCRWCSVADFFN